MDCFTRIVSRIIKLGTIIAAVFLAGIMLLIVASVIVRPSGHVIAGSYEMIELLIVITVAFALAYTALLKGHVAVDILMERFSKRTQAIVAIFTWFLSFTIWGLITWANIDIMREKWLLEQTELLLVPYLPFRIVWIFGLALFCVIFLMEMINSIRQVVKQ